MNRKAKGISGERELIHLFWQTGAWTAIRVAGSGSMKYPSPDIVAQSHGRVLAIECKKSKDSHQYLPAEEIRALCDFAELSGAEAWIAVRFDRKEWKFIQTKNLKTTETQYVVELGEGVDFSTLIISRER